MILWRNLLILILISKKILLLLGKSNSSKSKSDFHQRQTFYQVQKAQVISPFQKESLARMTYELFIVIDSMNLFQTFFVFISYNEISTCLLFFCCCCSSSVLFSFQQLLGVSYYLTEQDWTAFCQHLLLKSWHCC